MRMYALLLGAVFTTGYGYAAEVAVSSVAAGRHAAVAPAAAVSVGAPLDPVWYGGVIDPITVESGGGPAKITTMTKSQLLDRGARCSQPGPSGYRAIL